MNVFVYFRKHFRIWYGICEKLNRVTGCLCFIRMSLNHPCCWIRNRRIRWVLLYSSKNILCLSFWRLLHIHSAKLLSTEFYLIFPATLHSKLVSQLFTSSQLDTKNKWGIYSTTCVCHVIPGVRKVNLFLCFRNE